MCTYFSLNENVYIKYCKDYLVIHTFLSDGALYANENGRCCASNAFTNRVAIRVFRSLIFANFSRVVLFMCLQNVNDFHPKCISARRIGVKQRILDDISNSLTKVPEGGSLSN